jgi:small-conductance mechanosensitive channel
MINLEMVASVSKDRDAASRRRRGDNMLQRLADEIKTSVLLSAWIVGPVVFLVWVVFLFALKKRILATTGHYLARHRSWAWADSLLDALSPAINIAIFAGGVALLDWILPLSPRSDRAFDIVLAGALILALIIFADRICRRMVERLATRSAALQGAHGLIQGGVRGVIIGLGVLVFLDSIGISITPLVASLGIGSLAVALALQDTLANLFAGIYMIAEKPVESGHFIKLESGEQGYVTRVGWRSTRIRMLTDSMVVVPNSKLAGSVITNFSLPHDEVVVTVDAGVDYSSDLKHVEQVTLEVAREVMAQADGAVRGFQPRVRYHTFGDSSITFTVWLGAVDFASGMAVRHEFIKRLHECYGRADISMPFPTRTLELTTGTILKLRQIMSRQEDGSKRI